MLLWASCYPLIVLIPENTNLMLVAFFRAFLSGILLAGLAMFKQEKFSLTWRNLIIVTFIGFTATSVGFWGMFNAGMILSPGIATVLNSTQPIFAFILATSLLNEPLHLGRLIAILVAFFGVLLLSIPLMGEGVIFGMGILFVLLAAFAVSVSNLLMKHVSEHIPVYSLMSAQFLIGAIPLGILAAQAPSGIDSNNAMHIGMIVSAMTIIGTAYPFVLWYKLLQNNSLSVVNTFSFLTPVFALIFGYFIFYERLSLLQWFGVAVVSSSVLIASRDSQPNN